MIDNELIIPVRVYVKVDAAVGVLGNSITRDELLDLNNKLTSLAWWYDLVNLAEMVSAIRAVNANGGYYVYDITWLLPEEQKLLFMLKYREKMPFIATIGEGDI